MKILLAALALLAGFAASRATGQVIVAPAIVVPQPVYVVPVVRPVGYWAWHYVPGFRWPRRVWVPLVAVPVQPQAQPPAPTRGADGTIQ